MAKVFYWLRCVFGFRPAWKDTRSLPEKIANAKVELAALGVAVEECVPASRLAAVEARLATANAERLDHRATLAAVEALPGEWETEATTASKFGQVKIKGAYQTCARELRAALAGPEGEKKKDE